MTIMHISLQNKAALVHEILLLHCYQELLVSISPA